MALSIGGLAFLDYGEVPACIHTRLILAEVNAATFEYVILTPDLDMYTEILHHSNPDLVGFHLPAPGGGPPPGIPLPNIYSFAPMQAADYGRFMAAGRAEGVAERARRGLAPVAVAAPPAAVPPAGAAVAAAKIWVLAEMVEGFKIGQEMHPPHGVPMLGDFGLMNLVDGGGSNRVVLVKQINPDELGTFCEERIQLARSSEAVEGDDVYAAEDIRTMSIRYLANGERRRAFKESVGEMTVVEMEDFPYTPRTCLEYLQAISTVAESVYGHHLSWVQQSKIPDGARAIYEDQVLSQILDAAISYDCLQVSNLACFELLVRRRQLLAEAHSHDPMAPNYQGADYWMGSKYKHGGAIVINSLTEHVARRLQADSQIMKEKRKLEEAKKLKGPKAAPKPKGGAAGGAN